MWKLWIAYFSVQVCPRVKPLHCVAFMLKSTNYRVTLTDGHFFMQHFPRKLLQWHLLRILAPAPIHSFINGQLETSSSKTSPRSPWCLFNMLAVHWDEEAGLHYWLRSAPLACFLSSAATSLPFFRRTFRKIKIGGTIKREKFLKKKKKTFEKVGGACGAQLDS